MALRRNPLFVLAGSATLVGVTLLATPAQAADSSATAVVTGNGGTFNFLEYNAHDTLINDVRLTLEKSATGTYVYTIDDIVDIQAGQNCVHPDPADLTLVSCDTGLNTSAALSNAAVRLGDGDDTLTFTNLTDLRLTLVDLGAGNDTYRTATPQAQDAAVFGDIGDDRITGGTSVSARGEDGDDTITLVGGTGRADGGAGNDEINGGIGDDTLNGDAGDDIIYGNDGDDSITGGTGNDQLYGGRHNDTIYGNSGDDIIYGNSGDDYISGGPGEDTISGGTGTNVILN